MAGADFPITDGQVGFHLKVAKRKVRAVAHGVGFILQIEHSDLVYALYTQRGTPRLFKNLTTVASFLKGRGVKRFTVILEQRSTDEETDKAGAEAATGKQGKRTPSRQSRTLSFDED